MCCHVLFIISTFNKPDIGNSQPHGGIGIGTDRYPFIGMNCRRVIKVGADKYLLDAQFGEPVAKSTRQLTLPAPGGGFQVAAPVQQ